MSFLRILMPVILLLAGSVAAQDSTASSPFTSIETAVCTGITDRMPTGEGTVFPLNTDTVYVWTKLIGATDTTEIKHVWYRDDQEIATVVLPVRSPSWRTWSYKSAIKDWAGNWEVKIEDAQGNILKSVKFSIESSPAKSTETEESPASDTSHAEPDSTK